MSRHSTEFKAEQELPAGAIEGLPKADHGNVDAAPKTNNKTNNKTRNIRARLRKLLLAGAAVAAPSGAVW